MARNKHALRPAASGGASGAAAEPASGGSDDRAVRQAKRAALADPEPEVEPAVKKADTQAPRPRGRPRKQPAKQPATHPPRPRGRPRKDPLPPAGDAVRPEAQLDSSPELGPTPEPEQAGAEPEQGNEAAAEPAGAPAAADAAEAAEAQGSAGPADAASPGGGRAKRRRSTRRLTQNDGENVVIDEQGNTVAVPPKHGTPAQHSRPKSGQAPGAEDLPPAGEGGRMMLRFHARDREGNWGSPRDPPTASLDISPAATFAQLRQLIAHHCPGLNPAAQQFYRPEAGGGHVQLDPQGAGQQTLAAAGFGLPGPHDLFLEIDMQALLASVGGMGLAAGPEGQPVPLAAAPPEAVAQQQPQPQQPQAAPPPAPELPESGDEDGMAPVQPQQPQQQEQQVLALPAPLNPVHRRGQPGSRRARPNNRWTASEVDNLLQGLMAYGTSAWTAIAERWQFQDRTTIDLKDKWRNLKKNVRDGRPVRGAALSEETRALVLRIMRENGEPSAAAAAPPALPPPASQ